MLRSLSTQINGYRCHVSLVIKSRTRITCLTNLTLFSQCAHQRFFTAGKDSIEFSPAETKALLRKVEKVAVKKNQSGSRKDKKKSSPKSTNIQESGFKEKLLKNKDQQKLSNLLKTKNKKGVTSTKKTAVVKEKTNAKISKQPRKIKTTQTALLRKERQPRRPYLKSRRAQRRQPVLQKGELYTGWAVSSAETKEAPYGKNAAGVLFDGRRRSVGLLPRTEAEILAYKKITENRLRIIEEYRKEEALKNAPVLQIRAPAKAKVKVFPKKKKGFKRRPWRKLSKERQESRRRRNKKKYAKKPRRRRTLLVKERIHKWFTLEKPDLINRQVFGPLVPSFFKNSFQSKSVFHVSRKAPTFIQKRARNFSALEVNLVTASGRSIDLSALSRKKIGKISTKIRRIRLTRRIYEKFFRIRRLKELYERMLGLNPVTVLLPGQGFLSFQTKLALHEAIKDEIKALRKYEIKKYEILYEKIPVLMKNYDPLRNEKEIVAIAWRRVRAEIFAPLLPRYDKIREPYFKKRLKKYPTLFDNLFAKPVTHQLLSAKVAAQSKILLRYSSRKQGVKPLSTRLDRLKRSSNPRRRRLPTNFYLRSNRRHTFYKRTPWFRDTYRHFAKRERNLNKQAKWKVTPVCDPELFVQYNLRKQSWRNRRRKRKASPSLNRVVSDRRIQSRKLRWPVAFPKKRQYRQNYWKARKLSRKRGGVAIAQTFFRPRSGLRKGGSNTEKLFARERRNTRESLKKLIPYYSVNYSLKPRKWHTPRDINGIPLPPVEISEIEKSKRILEKDLRHYEKQRLTHEGRAAVKSKDRVRLLKLAFSKKLNAPKYRDDTWRHLELRTGYPATLGYRYKRRTHRNSFVTNRWSQPIADTTRMLHPFALVPAEQQPKSFLNHPINSLYHTELEIRKGPLWEALNFKLSRPTTSRNSSFVFEEQKEEVYRIRNFPSGLGKKRSSTWRKYFTLVTGDYGWSPSLFDALYTDVPYWILNRQEERRLGFISPDLWSELAYEINVTQEITKPRITGKEAKMKALEHSRELLFKLEPDWWVTEAKLRKNALKAVIKRFSGLLFKRTLRRLRSRAKKRSKKRRSIRLRAKLLRLPKRWGFNQVENFLAGYSERFFEKKLSSSRRPHNNIIKRRKAITQEIFCDTYYNYVDDLRLLAQEEEIQKNSRVLIYGEGLKRREVARDALPANYATDLNPFLKENGALHQLWASGLRNKSKSALSVISSYPYNLEKPSVVYQLPYESPRFPATANRQLSFARAVRVFYNKTISPRLRTINYTNSRAVRVSKLRDKKVFSSRYLRNSITQAKRQALTKASLLSYLPSNARVLARAKRKVRPNKNLRSVSTVTGARKNIVKRRFTRSPIELRGRETKLHELARRSPRRKGQSATLAGVLKSARKQRSKLRVVTEKKKLIRRRGTPAEQVLPRWRRLRERRQRANQKKGAKHARKEASHSKARSNSWVRSSSKTLRYSREYRAESVCLVDADGRAFTEVSNIDRVDWAKHGYSTQTRSRRAYQETLTLGRLGRRVKLSNLRVLKLKEPSKQNKTKLFLTPWQDRKFKSTPKIRRFFWRFKKKRKVCKLSWLKGKRFGGHYKKAGLISRARRNSKKASICGEAALHRKRLIRQGRYFAPYRSWESHAQDTLYAQKLGLSVRRVRAKKRGRAAFQLKNLAPAARVDESIAKKELRTEPKKTTNARVLQTVAQNFSPSPLSFYSQRTELVDSAALTMKDKAFQTATTQGLYRITEQLATSTTQLYSHLISWLRKQRGSGSGRAYTDAEKLVSATYWNLRIYLSQDILGMRLWTKDKTLELRRNISDEIYLDANKYPPTEIHTSTRRKRTQHYWLTRSEPRRAASLRWLRHWFPRLYKYHLESPDTFEILTFSRTEARRSKPCSAAFINWETQDISGNDELVFDRRVVADLGKNSARYETRLRTARHKEAIDRCKNLDSQVFSSFISLSKVSRSQFFAKGYSSQSGGDEQATVNLLANRVYQQNRKRTLAEEGRTPQQLINLYPQMKTRINLRVSYSGAGRRGESYAGSLDPRATRQKSPRNALYLQRRPVPHPYPEFKLKESVIQKAVSSPRTSEQGARVDKLFIRPLTSNRRGASELSVLRDLMARRRKAATSNTHFDKKHYEQFKRITALKSHSNNYNSWLHEKNETVDLHRRHSSGKSDATLPFVYEPKILRDTKVYLNSKIAERVNRCRVYRKNLPVTIDILTDRPTKRYSWANFGQDQPYRQLNLPSAQLLLTASPIVSANSSETNELALIAAPALTLKTDSRFNNQVAYGCFNTRNLIYQAAVNHYSEKFEARLEKSNVNILNVKRGEFWAKLTTRYYLKARLVKTWIKDRKRILIRVKWSYIPEIIFKEMRARLRGFEWHESDRYFFRKGWKYAFNLNPSERERSPWFESLRRRRTAYSTRHGEYRRYAFPREQKRFKALQYYRKARVSAEPHRLYVKWRRWPRIRTTAYRRYRSFFEFRNTRVAQKHFKKLSKQSHNVTGFSRNSVGTRNRLDVVLHLLGITKTVFWARVIAPFGILRVNGIRIYKANYRFKAGDILVFDWGRVQRLHAEFTIEKHWSLLEEIVPFFKLHNLPGNFSWRHTHNFLYYDRLPTPDDLVKNTRVVQWRFDSFRRDAGIGRR